MPWPFPRMIAHRGGAELAPENTLPAFAEAARRGYRAIETDVTLTADGVPVLFHDRTLKRTAGGRGAIARARSADLARLDAGAWFHPRFAGTRIPTLAEGLACWQDLRLQAVIELKVNPRQDPAVLARVVVAELRARWRGDPPLLISFSVKALAAAAAAAAPDIPRAWLADAPWPLLWRRRIARTAACAIDIDHKAITPARVARCHAAGLAVLAWTVNDPKRAARLLAMGVDGVTTDAIGRIAP